MFVHVQLTLRIYEHRIPHTCKDLALHRRSMLVRTGSLESCKYMKRDVIPESISRFLCAGTWTSTPGTEEARAHLSGVSGSKGWPLSLLLRLQLEARG